MEHSDISVAETAKPMKPSDTLVTLRTLVSAGLFGTLGGVLGDWLGKRSNPSGNRTTQRVMKWGMGLFSAIVAAYSSLKASEREAEAAKDLVTPIKGTKPAEAPALDGVDNKIPLSMIHATGETHGKVAERSQISGIEK